MSLFAIKPLFVKKGLIIFQKFLLLEKSLPPDAFPKWRFILSFLRFVRRFLYYIQVGTFKLPHGLPKDLKEISGKPQHFIELLPDAHSSSRNENFVSASKNLLKNKQWTFIVVRYFLWKLEFVSNILWMLLSGNNFSLLTHPRPFQFNSLWQFS